jgi:hypothetical protein
VKFLLDFGQTVDLLSPHEMSDLLLDQDTRNRASYAGVKVVNQFYNLGQTGGASQVFTTPANLPASGRVWSVMNVGLELAVASAVRIFKGVVPGAAPIGNARVVGFIPAANIVQAGQFSKGQIILNTSDQLTFYAPVNLAFILSVYLTAIELPAEKIGELLL